MEGSAVVPEQPLFRKGTALPFVISTGAQRSGEICGCSGPTSFRGSTCVPINNKIDREVKQRATLKG